MRHIVYLPLGLATLTACVEPDKPSGFGLGITDSAGPPPMVTTVNLATTEVEPIAGTDSTSEGTTTSSGSEPVEPTTDTTTTTSGAVPPDLPADGGTSTTGVPDPTGDLTSTTAPPAPVAEGQLCFENNDCPDAAPYCADDHQCHDGDEGDPCDNDGDCAAFTPSCVEHICYDGNEGDPCKNDHDCGPTSPVCLIGQCWDGQEGDPCNNHSDCAPFFGCYAGACTDASP